MRYLLLLCLTLPILTTSLSSSDHDLSLLPRQAPGTPQYDCHAACGSVIQQSRTPEYCTSTNFTTSLTSCLSCALTFDIWQYYSDSVSEAATTCNLDATPLAANSTSSITSVSSLTGAAASSASSASSASRNTDQVTLSETGTVANPSATGDSTEETASLSETQVTVSETGVASATAASETADGATRPMRNEVLGGLGLLAWLVV